MKEEYFVSGISEIDEVIDKLNMCNIQLPLNSELVFIISKEQFKTLPLPMNMITDKVSYNTKSGIKVIIQAFNKFR